MSVSSVSPAGVVLGIANDFSSMDVVVSSASVPRDESGKKILPAGTIVGGIGKKVLENRYTLVGRHGNPMLTTALIGYDNDVRFVSKSSTTYNIVYSHTSAPNTPLSVAYSSPTVTFTLGTDASGNIITTANDIVALVAITSSVNTLLTATLADPQQGGGIVTAMASTPMVPINNVSVPEGILFNSVDVTEGNKHVAMIYAGSIDIAKLPVAPTAAQVTALSRISFVDYNNMSPLA